MNARSAGFHGGGATRRHSLSLSASPWHYAVLFGSVRCSSRSSRSSSAVAASEFQSPRACSRALVKAEGSALIEGFQKGEWSPIIRGRSEEVWGGPGCPRELESCYRHARNAERQGQDVPGSRGHNSDRSAAGELRPGDVEGMDLDRLRRGVRGCVRRIRLVLKVTGALIRASAFGQ